MRYLQTKEKHELIRLLLQKQSASPKSPSINVKEDIIQVITAYYQKKSLSDAEKLMISKQIYNAMYGLDVLQELIDDPEITEIMVNGPKQIFIEKNGHLFRSPLFFENETALLLFIQKLFGQANKQLNEKHPIGDMQLTDGSRIHVVLAPISTHGPSINIRRFTAVKPTLEALIQSCTLTAEAALFLKQAVQSKKNIFISGGTGSGKTTLLNALSSCISKSERVISIEDSPELQLHALEHWVQLTSRKSSPDGRHVISLAELIRTSLRMRPDRIIVGEVRGAECREMIHAMATGHPGSMSTGHGNSAKKMLERLCLMVLMAADLPWEAIRKLIASTLDLLIHLERNSVGKRQIKEILSLDGYENGHFHVTSHFQRNSNDALVPCQNLKTQQEGGSLR